MHTIKKKIAPNLMYKMSILTFVILVWIISANLYSLIRYVGIKGSLGPGLMKVTPEVNLFVQATVGSLLIGVLLGVLEVFVYPKFARRVSFGMSLLNKGVIFIVVICVLIYCLSTYYGYRLSYDSDEEFNVIDFYFSSTFGGLFIYMLITNFLIDFALQMNKRVGPGVIKNMLRGKYYKPREEERVFMFLDLQSSTHIAEILGHVKFSLLLQDCFRDLSDLLMGYSATVYQFVGDEAVLTWSQDKGLEECHCLAIYYHYHDVLKQREKHYKTKYGVHPIFKASVHMGKVTVAEVGNIKSEIAYHGDVLNTAARVQGLCNQFKANLLITEKIYRALPDVDDSFDVSFLEEAELKGKKEKVGIYRVDLPSYIQSKVG